jgi:hypothetical protein
MKFVTIFLISCFYFQTISFAQNESLEEPASILTTLSQIPAQIHKISNENFQKWECSKQNDIDDLDMSDSNILGCVAENATETITLIQTYDSKDELPEPIKKLSRYHSILEGENITIMVTVTNDNLQAGPVPYAFAILTDRKTGGKEGKKLDGNDIYRTHGVELSVSKKTLNGITYTGSFFTELYTKPVAPGVNNDNYFTEDNLISFFLDNKKQKKTYYWSVGAGVRVLNNQETIGILASGQQKTFHQYVNSSNQTQFHNVKDGLPLRWGPFTNLAIGINRTLASRGECSLEFTGEVGAHMSTISKTNKYWAEGSFSGLFGIRKSLFKVGVKGQTLIHRKGTQITPIVYLAFRRPRWEVTSSVETPTGTMENSMLYNLDSEPIAKLSLFYFIPHK